MMLRRQAIFLLASTVSGALVPRAWAQEVSPDFAPGQMWSLKSYPAKVIVGIIEPWFDTTVVHVSVMDIPGGIISQVNYLPIEKSALAASVDQLLSRDAKTLQGFEAEYREWKANSGSGIFSSRVPQTIALLIKNRNLVGPPSAVGQ
jgi:hypothetical protein